jgi:hypothetical protein
MQKFKRFPILHQVSLEARLYQLASSVAAASDVTVTILLLVHTGTLPSDKQKLHDVLGGPCSKFVPDIACIN